MTAFSCFLIGNEPLTPECGKKFLEMDHQIMAVTTSDKAVETWETEAGLEVLKGAKTLVEGSETVDLLFSVTNLERIPRTVLVRASRGDVNFHDRALPGYTGLNVPVWSILTGETTHGITWHLMEEVAGVTQAIAVARHDTSGVAQIYGHFTGATSKNAVRNALIKRLPVFMVPTKITGGEVFPLTPNCKIDRKALLKPRRATAKVTAPAPAPELADPDPGSEVTMEDITAIWQGALHVLAIQPSDNFFDLDGHSPLAIEVHRTMGADLGRKGLSTADIARARTLCGDPLHTSAPTGMAEMPKVTKARAQAVAETATILKRRALRANRATGA